MPAKQVENLIIGHVRESFALDAGLQKGTQIERLSAKYVEQIMFNPDASSRASAIAGIQSDVVSYFENTAAPAAVAQGRRQATDLIKLIGGARPAADILNDETARRRILYEGQLSVSQRVQVFQRLVSDAGNTLENRLGAYWLEPGRTAGQKLDTLRRIHENQDAARRTFEDRLKTFRGGEGTRPARPQLDYLSRFTAYTTDESRAQARRAGTDAEHSTFQAQGFNVFTWVTVNASDACPDCRRRQGTTGTMDYFQQIGKPGSGATVCGSRCFCILVPKQTVYHAPGLARGVTVGGPPPQPVLDDKATTAQIDASKATPPANPVAVARTPVERLQEGLRADIGAGDVHRKVLAAGKRWEKRIEQGQAAELDTYARGAAINARRRAAFDRPETDYPGGAQEKRDTEEALIKELEAVGRERTAIGAQLNADREKSRAATRRALAIPDAERFEAIKALPTSSPVNYSPTRFRSKETAKNVKEGGAFIQSIWRRPPEFSPQPGGSASLRYAIVENSPSFRAHMSGRVRGADPSLNVMEVAEGQGVPVIVHELGHEIEFRHAQGYDLAKTFLEMRRAGQATRKLKDVFPANGYRDDEKGIDDQFGAAFGASAWYVGKDYDFKATEILSMGVQKLYENAAHFAKADPEYFRFVIGVLRGTLTI